MPDRRSRTLRGQKRLAWAVFLLVLRGSLGSAVAEGLTPEERKVVDAATALQGQAEALLEKVVNIPSASENLPGVREVGRVFSEEFARIGFKTRWEEMPPSMKRAGHLIVEREGTRGPRLLLIGHLDTVLEGKPFERRERRASGTGTVDMKGGDVVILFALKALQDAGRLDGARVSVILTGDEEAAGDPVETSRGSMRELAGRSEIALAFEAAIDDTATVARRGVSTWTLRVSSPTGHSSGVLGSRIGPGSVFEAARVLDGFRRELAGENGLTFNPALIFGGTTVNHQDGESQGTAEGKDNVVAGVAVVEGDLRFLSNPQREAAKTTMRSIASKNLPRSTTALTFQDSYPAMAPTPGNFALLDVLDRASRDLGLGPVRALDPAERGAGDISFVAPMLSGLDGLGVRGGGSHAPHEWIDLDCLGPQIQRAAILIDRLSRGDRGTPR